MRRFAIKTFLTAFCIALFSLSCGGHKKHHEAVEPGLWEPYISAYTSGVVSRETAVRVRLTNDVVSESQVNKPLESSPLSIKPGEKGTSVWVDRRTIEFRPEKRLKDDYDYTGELALSKLMQVPAANKVFKFDFHTMQQTFDVRVDGLQPLQPDELKWQHCPGAVVTADVENGEPVEKVVSAKQAGRSLRVTWQHSENRLVHNFIIDSIERKDDSTVLEISWNGHDIGVNLDGGHSIHVPAIDEFSVLDVQCIPGDRQHVLIRFSDPLNRKQDLRGLITLSGDEATRFTIDRNEVHAYPEKHLSGVIDIMVNQGLRNVAGRKFKQAALLSVTIESVKPDVRFAGKGVILPGGANATIPFEAVNLGAIDVCAYRIYENNIPQFFQVNDLEGENELQRVGRIVWQKTVHLNVTQDMRDRWIRCGFDASPLLAMCPSCLYRIELRFRKCQSLYPCASMDTAICEDIDKIFPQNADEEHENSFWNYYNTTNTGDLYSGGESEGEGEGEGENDGGGGPANYQDYWSHRDDPCHQSYYQNHGGGYRPAAGRNFFASDIGLIAQRGAGDTMLITATRLTSAQPLSSVNITVNNYQNQAIGKGQTGGDGFCNIALTGKPYLVIAENGLHKGYMRVDDGSQLPVSHLDVGGAPVQKGIKGFLYGERGVWRPGDSLFLTFALEDKTNRLPREHPVTFELVNPRNQVVSTITRTASVDRFYNFSTCTRPDAPTGNYIGRVKVGGATFETPLKIETVMPNRLKVKLDFGTDTLVAGRSSIKGRLSARWLTGATAKNLDADAEATLEPVTTVFPKYGDYVFDDPVRVYKPETQKVFEGKLGGEGVASFSTDIKPNTEAPGMLRAQFRSRVFEEGGAFSVDRFSLPFAPYKRFVGILLPKGDRARGMLLTDTTHVVRIVTVAPNGALASARRIQMKLYKVDWRWWWEKGDDRIADYISSSEHHALLSDTVRCDNGQGVWMFRVKYPEWGRFLVRAMDLESGHAAGKFVYIDWPGWAGRTQKETPGGATVLSFSSDKDEYEVGEKATLTVPSGENGRILISLENGSRVLREFWVNAKQKETPITFDITPEMTPNIYAFATYLQPYSQTVNDLPIRMYGVVPLRVTDAATKLAPVIGAPDVITPGEKATVTVSEKAGREMAYTLALVDEGLLDLTRFQTPDLWSAFYTREALGVRTWDLFDFVCGAYGAKLERLLAVGGDEGLQNPGQKRGNRFPPMVRFLGPFHLDRNRTARHNVDIPQYVGAVRVMVVAGEDGAYGRAEKSCFVRKPLMVLGTLPRVLGPQETVKLPISVFALEKDVKNVKVSVSVKGDASIAGAAEKSMSFTEPGDELVVFDLAAGRKTGFVKVGISATSGANKATQDIDIEIRNPSRPMTQVTDTVLESGSVWNSTCSLPGVAGTNAAVLELSRIPPIDLGRRLDYLVMYPFGCVEQTTSSVFPQLFLKNLMEIPSSRMSEIQKNVEAGIDRLREFQTSAGGFSFWPGSAEADPWGTNYAGHFLLEAKLAGYSLPPAMIDLWLRFQKTNALSWSATEDYSELIQAYRLYTLALAQKPEMGAMNRLAEKTNLSVATKWRLAAAYALAGQPDAAQRLVKGIPFTVKKYRELAFTYGSDIRDRAMILETLTLLGDNTNAARVAKELSIELTKDEWMSTQTTAYSLLAMAKFAGKDGVNGKIDVLFSENGAATVELVSSAAVLQQKLNVSAAAVTEAVSLTNKGSGIVYARIIARGTPAIGQEKPSGEGLTTSVQYQTKKGEPLEVSSVAQGTDLVALVTVSTQSGTGPYRQLALSQIFPSGWEIRNARMEGAKTEQSEFTYQDIRDDRVYTYFDIGADESKKFRVELNAAYLGKYYLPATYCEAMYDASVNAAVPGKWIEVKEAGK